jgi:DNA-binding response OmpR family regulator
VGGPDVLETSDRYFLVGVLEGDPDTRGLVMAALRRAQVVAVNLSRVDEMRAACEHIRPRVIVFDVGIPDEDELDLMRMLRARDIAGALSIVLLAGAPEVTLPMEVCELVDVYVKKPANWDTIARVVINLATGRRPPSTGVRVLRPA